MMHDVTSKIEVFVFTAVRTTYLAIQLGTKISSQTVKEILIFLTFVCGVWTTEKLKPNFNLNRVLHLWVEGSNVYINMIKNSNFRWVLICFRFNLPKQRSGEGIEGEIKTNHPSLLPLERVKRLYLSCTSKVSIIILMKSDWSVQKRKLFK
jgi:hypothetical protein